MKFSTKMKYVAAGLILSTNLFASDVRGASYDGPQDSSSNMYIGIGSMSGTGIQTLTDIYGNEKDYSYTSSGGSVKIGFIAEDNNRIELSINSFDIKGDSGWKDTYTGYDLDYLWIGDEKSNLSLYAGIGFGLYTSDKLLYNSDTNSWESSNALSLNVSLGLLYDVSSSLEFELAYKYKYLSWDYSENNIDSVYDTMGNAYAGINFKF